MENRLTRIFKIAVALCAILVLGMLTGFATTVNAEEPLSNPMVIATEKDILYTFTPQGCIVDNDQIIPHTGDYIITGEANVDIAFTSDEGEPITYNVVFHSWQAVAQDWYGIFSVEYGVTLNVTLYGKSVLKGFNHPGISVGEKYEGAEPPVVNFTLTENSRITVGCQYYGTEKCVADEVTVTINSEAISSRDMNGAWRDNDEIVFSRGTDKSHNSKYSYLDENNCQLVCDDCDLLSGVIKNHQYALLALDREHADYDAKHELICKLCGHVSKTESHSFRYSVAEDGHIAFCNECEYRSTEQSHSLNDLGCEVCGEEFIASIEQNGETKKYLTLSGIMAALKEKGGTLTLLRNINSPFGNVIMAKNADITIDLAGFNLGNIAIECEATYKVTMINSSSEKTGEWYCDDWNPSGIKGELLICGVTANTVRIIADYGGQITLENVVCKGKTTLGVWEGSGARLVNVTVEKELLIGTTLEDAENITIESGSFNKIATENNVPVVLLLADGYAYSANGALLDGSKNELSGITAIVEHTEHTEGAYHWEAEFHWQGCECGYSPTEPEKELHTIDDEKNCPTCSAEIVAVVSGNGTSYFTSLESAFNKAQELKTAEIELIRDAELREYKIEADCYIKLDLHGYKLQLTQNRITVYGSLVITDESEGAHGMLASRGDISYALEIRNGGSLTVINGEIFGLIYTALYSEQEATVTINGGRFTGTEKFRLSSGTIIEINGGVFECEDSVFNLGFGENIKLTINGGVFKNSTIFDIDDISEFSFDSFMGTDMECQIVLIDENGTAVTVADVTRYYDGTIVAVHEKATIQPAQDCHYYSCLDCKQTKALRLEHTVKYEATEDKGQHKMECAICKTDMGTEEHTGGIATCQKQASCQHCGEAYGEYNTAVHTTFRTKIVPNGDKHNKVNACCGTVIKVLDHTYDNDCDTECNDCQATRAITHKYDNACDSECNVCKASREVNHVYGKDGRCISCGAEGGEAEGGMGAGAIAAIVIGTAIVLGGGAFLFIWFVLRKKYL